MPNELTNPNNVVTEERLAQFYQQILPYMGGMPDVLANKFNRADLYSTDEKIIGRWIDGKPLYQKVFTGTTRGSEQSATIGTIANVDSIPVMYGNARNSSGTYLGIPNAGLNVEFSSGNLKTYTIAAAYANQPCIIIALYTKTTDSAVEIGSDTDYSTTEKIVGTWIDGKPLWQKTISCGTVTADGSWHEVQHSISGIDQVVRADGALFGNNGAAVPVCSVVSSFNFTAYAEADKTKVNYVVGSSRSSGNYKLYVTIQYTKTSS